MPFAAIPHNSSERLGDTPQKLREPIIFGKRVQPNPNPIPTFLPDLENEGVSLHTVCAYGAHLRAWAKWCDPTTGSQALTAAAPRMTVIRWR